MRGLRNRMASRKLPRALRSTGLRTCRRGTHCYTHLWDAMLQTAPVGRSFERFTTRKRGDVGTSWFRDESVPLRQVRERRALRDVYYRGNGRERRERRPEAPRGRFTLLMAAPPSQFAEGSHVTSCTPTGRVQTNWVGIGFWAALRSAAPHRSAVNRSQPQQFQFKLAIANKSLQARPRRGRCPPQSARPAGSTKKK